MSPSINCKNIIKVLAAIAIAYCYAYLISIAYIYAPSIPQPPEWFKSLFGKSSSGYGPSSYVYPWLKIINTVVVFIVAFPIGVILHKVFKNKAYFFGFIGCLLVSIYAEISRYCIVSTILADEYKSISGYITYRFTAFPWWVTVSDPVVFIGALLIMIWLSKRYILKPNDTPPPTSDSGV